MAKPMVKSSVFIDNMAALELGKDHELRSAKHVHLKYLYIRQLVGEGKVTLPSCNTNEQKADALTKGLPWLGLQKFVSDMGLKTNMNPRHDINSQQ